MDQITAQEFRARLEALCVNRGNPGLPRRQRDQLILLGSILLGLEPERGYTELEINTAIEQWLADVGQAVDIDHVTLRRLLIDNGFLSRDPAGSVYKVEGRRMAALFDPEIASIDPRQVIWEARARREERKQARGGT